MNLDPRVFPTILMILDFIAAIPYAVQGMFAMPCIGWLLES